MPNDTVPSRIQLILTPLRINLYIPRVKKQRQQRRKYFVNKLLRLHGLPGGKAERGGDIYHAGGHRADDHEANN